ncbi:MAG: type II toxin-antitoxin system ParD family antitoxin [Pseudomonadota bacterium]
MTAKASISLTDAQEAYARDLVAGGRYPSLSAVLQHGLELLRAETEAAEAELAALRALLDERRRGAFIDSEEGRARTAAMIAARKAGDAL